MAIGSADWESAGGTWDVYVVRIDTYWSAGGSRTGRKLPDWMARSLHRGTIAGITYSRLIMNAERRRSNV